MQSTKQAGGAHLVEVENLTKTYGNHKAISNLSFSVEKGQVYGFLGPNGAGKSTTMNIMTGCLSATSGDVRINGYDIFEEPEKAKQFIGYLPEIPPLYLSSTPREYLEFVAEAKGIRASEMDGEIERVMSETQIHSVADRLCKNLSKGYKQRVGIAQALLGNPDVIILDEPTVGLDPRQIIEIRELIKELSRQHTVILSSHILSEVQAVCDQILIISKGQLVASDTPENLEKLFAGKANVDLLIDAPADSVKELLIAEAGEANVTAEDTEDGKCRAEVTAEDSDDICRRLFFRFASEKIAILQMNTTKASLEDIFIELTSDEYKETPGAAAGQGGEDEDAEDSDAFDEEAEAEVVAEEAAGGEEDEA